jgi:hypothetical protein
LLWVLAGGVIVSAGAAGVMFLSPKPPASPVAAARATAPDARSATDAGQRIRVPVTDLVPSRLPADGTPRGWQLKEFTGQAAVEVVRSDGRLAVRMRSDRASFALHRDVIVDLAAFPYLTWSWKVTRLPLSGDVRDPARDDQAAQVYVVFPRWPSPRTASDVIGYVWDSRAPVGTRLTHPRAANVRIIVVESGRGNVDSWQRYQRNVAQDYAAVFGRPAPRVGKVALMVDSNDTRAEAEALIGELIFSRTPPGRAEIPSIVLR